MVQGTLPSCFSDEKSSRACAGLVLLTSLMHRGAEEHVESARHEHVSEMIALHAGQAALT